MKLDTLQMWHQLVQSRNSQGLSELLSDDVVFYSPVVQTPQIGKGITSRYLSEAFHVFFNESFSYIREVVDKDGQGAILEFEFVMDDVLINGVEMMRWNGDGKINEFKVMIRPFKAINLVHQKMASMLKQNRVLSFT